jgi:hypothetical protein
LQRAAELVASNRVPIEITRGAAAAKAAANAALAGVAVPLQTYEDQSQKKGRSAIVVSTAKDLHQIVSHSKNLWAKYNAIAKEHNQKVNWTTVAKELGVSRLCVKSQCLPYEDSLLLEMSSRSVCRIKTLFH